MDPLTASISAGGSILSGVTSGLMASRQMKKAAELQRTNSRWAANWLPKHQRAGLERAGYNPMLAINGGQAGMSSPVAPVGAGDMGLGDATSALDQKMEDEETRKREEEEKKRLEKKQDAIDQHNQDNQDKIVNANVKNIKAQTANTAVQTKILKEQNKWSNSDDNIFSRKFWSKKISSLFSSAKEAQHENLMQWNRENYDFIKY